MNCRTKLTTLNCLSCGERLSKVSPAFFKGDLYAAMDKKSKHFIESSELAVAAFYKGNRSLNKKSGPRNPPLIRLESRKKFKWTVRTWRLKIKRYLRANPMVLNMGAISSGTTNSSEYQSNLSRHL